MTTKIALQTFTIRRHLKSPAAIEKSLEQVKKLGFNAIELAYIKLADAEINAVANACKRLDIKVVSSQITFDFLQKNQDWIIDAHLQKLECDLTTVSVLPRKVIKGGKREMIAFADELNQLGAYFSAHGLGLAFHHHDYEYRRYGEQLGLDLLLQHADPNDVGLIVDCYWTQRGGRSPQAVINELRGRVKGIHLRDYSVRPGLFDMQTTDVALGHGNLDLNAIVQACTDNKVSYMAIEQATPQPFEQLQISVDYLRQQGHGDLF